MTGAQPADVYLARWLSGIPRRVIVLRILHPIRISALCPAVVRALISRPMILLYR